MEEVYYSESCDLGALNNCSIAVIGYGIQGQAQALNLRDSGLNVIIGNRPDDYFEIAKKDGFEVYDIDKAAKLSDIIMINIPDESHKEIFKSSIYSNLTDNKFITFAHGYSLRYNKLNLPQNIDISMIAPRYPGKQVRNYYLDGHGVPAFFDIISDVSGTALSKTLALGRALGFSKAGLISVGYQDETDLDLFIEHFVGPLIFRMMEEALGFLVKKNYPALPALMELYASGEMGAFWQMCARDGMYETLKNNASPTCQFGVVHYYDKIFEKRLLDKMEEVITNIQNGTFSNLLEIEEAKGYPTVKKHYSDKSHNLISKTEEEKKRIVRFEIK